MIYELRQYTVKNGKMKQWLKIMEEDIVPFQSSQGMVIPAMFTVPKEKDRFIWLRRFASEAERKRQYRKVYQSHQWKDVIQPKIDKVLDIPAIIVTDMAPVPSSMLR
jgi:hypothetical protein